MLSPDLTDLDRCYPCGAPATGLVGFVRARRVGVLVGVCQAHPGPLAWPDAALADLSALLSLAEYRAGRSATH